jgi:hypothetical protein
VGGFCSQVIEGKKAMNVNLRERGISEKERTFIVCMTRLLQKCFWLVRQMKKSWPEQPLLIST